MTVLEKLENGANVADLNTDELGELLDFVIVEVDKIFAETQPKKEKPKYKCWI